MAVGPGVSGSQFIVNDHSVHRLTALVFQDYTCHGLLAGFCQRSVADSIYLVLVCGSDGIVSVSDSQGIFLYLVEITGGESGIRAGKGGRGDFTGMRCFRRRMPCNRSRHQGGLSGFLPHALKEIPPSDLDRNAVLDGVVGLDQLEVSQGVVVVVGIVIADELSVVAVAIG